MGIGINEYLSSLKGKKVAVIGIGVSNTPLIKLLLRAGIDVTACDRRGRAEFGEIVGELESLGAKLKLGEDYLSGLDHNVIFRTPGLRPDIPEFIEAKRRGSIITSEMEAFFKLCPCTTIGVTGSDGKTTTTTLIYELLRQAGKNVFIGGNIGRPLLPDVDGMQAEDFAVLELSSFQLMTMSQSPDIAVVTNVTPNHLDMHKSMEEYVEAKVNIFSHQGPGGKVILNFDNELTRGFGSGAPGKVVYFSRLNKLAQGVFFKDGTIYYRDVGKTEQLLETEDILLPGTHNIENYMAAISAVYGIVGREDIIEVAREFKGVVHRIELVRTLDGVSYYNDSIASSPTRTIAGLNSFNEKVILIAGGYDKHIPFDPLGPEVVKHVKLLVLTGATAAKIRAAVESTPSYKKDNPEILQIDDFYDAVRAASAAAVPGDIVILSPACASFDRFKNFEERGEVFKKIIYEL